MQADALLTMNYGEAAAMLDEAAIEARRLAASLRSVDCDIAHKNYKLWLALAAKRDWCANRRSETYRASAVRRTKRSTLRLVGRTTIESRETCHPCRRYWPEQPAFITRHNCSLSGCVWLYMRPLW